MSSEMLGENTFRTEATNKSSHDLWLLSAGKELFMSYDDFPWFKDVPIGEVLNIEEPIPGHFYWPDLDVDLSIESIEHPDRFPLKAINTGKITTSYVPHSR